MSPSNQKLVNHIFDWQMKQFTQNGLFYTTELDFYSPISESALTDAIDQRSTAKITKTQNISLFMAHNARK